MGNNRTCLVLGGGEAAGSRSELKMRSSPDERGYAQAALKEHDEMKVRGKADPAVWKGGVIISLNKPVSRFQWL